jgi:hypothetical protein
MQDKLSDEDGWFEGDLSPEPSDETSLVDTDYVADDQPISDLDVIPSVPNPFIDEPN